MESSSIVVKVMYCRDLKAFNFFQKLSVYALVSISSEDPDKKLEPSQQQQQRTPTDGEGDGNPEWKHEMRFDLDEASFQDYDHLFIHFELHAEAVFGDKNIGEVRVPLKDLIDESNGIVRFVSYEVRASDGKSNGVLNFSYKVNEKSKGNEIIPALPVSNIDGYSVVHHPSPEILYPTVQVESCPPLSEVQYPSPSLELSSPSHETYSGPEGDHHHSPELQHTSHEVHYPPPYDNYYPPPPRDSYYPPEPPPPPPHDSYYPPEPPPPPPHDNYYSPGPPPPPHLLPPPLLHHHHHHHQGPPPMMHGPFHHPHPPPPPPIHPWTFASGYDSSEYRP